jgi:hypothetical protein
MRAVMVLAAEDDEDNISVNQSVCCRQET